MQFSFFTIFSGKLMSLFSYFCSKLNHLAADVFYECPHWEKMGALPFLLKAIQMAWW
jgi:hypothetical protein